MSPKISESYETIFLPDDLDNTKFKAHFRRIKSRKRAAIKNKVMAEALAKAIAEAKAKAKKAT